MELKLCIIIELYRGYSLEEYHQNERATVGNPTYFFFKLEDIGHIVPNL